jgi:hypothetical protein
MSFLNINSIDNEALLVKLLDELRSAMKAGNLNTGLAKTFSEKIEETINTYNLGLHPKGQVVSPEVYIRNVVTQVERLNETQLYAGLTLMCKDILNDPAKTKNNELVAVIDAFFKEECINFNLSPLFHEEPVYKTSGTSGISIKKGWYNGEIPSLLMDPAIVHEWASIPGQKLFEKFKEKFKDVICKGDDSIYMKMEKGLLGQADLPVTIVSTILAAGISVSTFWIPIIVYFALLLIKTGLKVYCEA